MINKTSEDQSDFIANHLLSGMSGTPACTRQTREAVQEICDSVLKLVEVKPISAAHLMQALEDFLEGADTICYDIGKKYFEQKSVLAKRMHEKSGFNH